MDSTLLKSLLALVALGLVGRGIELRMDWLERAQAVTHMVARAVER